MQIKSITTSLGAAILLDFSQYPQPVTAPDGWGLILWQRAKSRINLLSIALNSSAAWIADYCPNQKVAIVVWPRDMMGDRIEVDRFELTSVLCPDCGSSTYTSSGRNWRCKRCDRQWPKTTIRDPYSSRKCEHVNQK